MFARLSWSKLAAQSSIEAGLANLREKILPSLQTQDGFLGAVVLHNREIGESVLGTYWQSAEAMAASEAMAVAGREQAALATGVKVTEMDRFEMLLQDRTGPVEVGTFVRMNDAQFAPGSLDAVVAFLRDDAIPTARSQNGYRASLVFANRETGRMLVPTVWNTAAEREASEARMSQARVGAATVGQAATGPRVTLYEVMFAEVSQTAQQATSERARAA